MVFDPMKFYDDGQRKQKRYDSLVPVFVVAIVLLVVFGAGFIAYQRSHVKPKPKPKPEQWAYQGRLCKGTDCREAIAAATATDPPFMVQCNDGSFDTDLRECPEYIQREKVHAIANSFIAIGEARERGKHKRNPLGTLASKYLTVGTVGWAPTSGVDDYNPHAHVTLQQLKNAQGLGQTCILAINGGCWITLDPDPEKKKPDCPPAPSGDAAYYVDSDGCLRITFTPMPTTCGADEECRWSVAHVTPDKPATTPQDITNLMEQIAPTSKQEDCESCPSMSTDERECKPIKCPDAGVPIEPTKPDCKMPADVDVCPTQTLDPKAVSDKVGKP